MKQLTLPLTEDFLVWRIIYNGEEIDYQAVCGALQFIKFVGGTLTFITKEREINGN